MKKRKIFLTVLICVFALVMTSATGIAAKDNCVSIQDNVLVYKTTHYLAGQPLQTGFDIFGYNYQSHLFNGYYVNVYLGGYGFPPYEGDADAYLAENPGVTSVWCWPYRDDILTMKWNDAWLSNKDCDNDGLLDRHYGFPSYIGSGAWETNHQFGTYDLEGKECYWNYFCKIVAVPADATNVNGIWYTIDGKEIGPVIWGEFAIIQEVYNDLCGGFHGLLYKSPARAGLGNW
ncbi:hypothetical protein KKF60_01660 [Patescibacteria group bacterium]|nr:hypothetical protein [Patescibacteria group bacterium]MBU4458588.1 hypothetical protein [Patescibacteria group bacterium]MCG2696345.1 hypothetical protein [Candidatus Portnoybacteria bacterium]